MRHLAMVSVVLSCLTVLPAPATGQAGVEAAVRQRMLDNYQYVRTNLRDEAAFYSREGSVEFWSSGGLLQEVPTDVALVEYEFNTLTAKHITVIPLSPEAAVVHMYVEGGFQAEGEQPVPKYLTRATLIMVLENGAWVSRAAHWSPIQGGTGTA